MTVFSGPAIHVPEKADPIFNPLKALADALKEQRVSIAPLQRIEGGARLGHPGAKQFTCTTLEDFPEVAAKIAELGRVVRFIEMFVPQSGVICAQTHKFGDVWARYVAAYDCPSDQQFGRWDVLVQPLYEVKADAA